MRFFGWIVTGGFGLLYFPALAQWLIAGAAAVGVCLLIASTFGLVGR